MIREKKMSDKPVIDLTGPSGNAFALIGLAENSAKQIGMSKRDCDHVIGQ